MNFLVWYNPLTWLGDVANEIVGSIVKAIRTLFYQLSVVIYKIVISLYNTFDTLCNARILNNDIIKQMSIRIGLILGIVMLFMVTISFIQMLLEPDNINDKEKGAVNIIKKVLIVIVMFAVSNFAFGTLYQFQKVVINSNIISKLLLPNSVDTDKFGGVLAAELFIAFYDVDSILKDSFDTSDNIVDPEGAEFCQNLVYALKTNIANDYNFELGYYCLNEHIVVDVPNADKQQEMHIIDFNLLLSPIVGCVCIWMLFSYCIMVGTRVIIIAFLEIISPMAFISYLSPKKDTMFSKWLKLYTATYLDAFIRIAIINFVVFLIATIFTYGETNTFWVSVESPDGSTKKFIMVLIVIALFTFAKKAPEMLKQLFPNNGGILGYSPSLKDISGLGMMLGAGTALATNTIGRGLSTIARTGKALGWEKGRGIKENLKNLKNLKNSDYRAAGKTLASGVASTALGGLTSLYRGGKAGYSAGSPIKAISSGFTAQGKANNAYNQRVASGVPISQRVMDAVTSGFGIDTMSFEAIDKELTRVEGIKNSIDNNKTVSFFGNQNKEVKAEGDAKKEQIYKDRINKRGEVQIKTGLIEEHARGLAKLLEFSLGADGVYTSSGTYTSAAKVFLEDKKALEAIIVSKEFGDRAFNPDGSLTNVAKDHLENADVKSFVNAVLTSKGTARDATTEYDVIEEATKANIKLIDDGIAMANTKKDLSEKLTAALYLGNYGQLSDLFRDTIKNGEAYDNVIKFTKADGTSIPIEVKRDSGGNITNLADINAELRKINNTTKVSIGGEEIKLSPEVQVQIAHEIKINPKFAEKKTYGEIKDYIDKVLKPAKAEKEQRKKPN